MNACWRRDRNDGTALCYSLKDQVNQSTTSAKVFAPPSEMLKSLVVGPKRDRVRFRSIWQRLRSVDNSKYVVRYVIHQFALFLILSFWMISIQYPSGSKTKARFFILPSVNFFFHATPFDSMNLQASSISSTERQIWPNPFSLYLSAYDARIMGYRPVPVARNCHHGRPCPALSPYHTKLPVSS